MIATSDQLERAIRAAVVSSSGSIVSPNTAMKVATVFACVRIISGTIANLPIQVKRRISADVREDASDHPLWKVLARRPNRWQTPSQFKRMMQAHLLLRGNAYARILKSVANDQVIELIPLHPDRVEVRQRNDLSLVFEYTRPDGGKVTLAQSEVFHLVGLTLDGVKGVSVITYARETIGMSLSMEDYGAKLFKNGARPSSVLTHPGRLGKEGLEFLKASLDDYKLGGDSEGKSLILEEGMKMDQVSMTSEDAQWLDSRKFSRTDITMFFGVPPHMIGDTEKSTSWGSGIEQQSIGYSTYTAEDHLTCWEEAIDRDLITDDDQVYAKFNRKALLRSDMKSRFEAYQIGRAMKVYSANDIRRFEDENPIEGGDVYENPNTSTDKAGNSNDPSKSA
ncbi:phage portal protein [Rhizobium sp. AAP43]|nr:phage portal protein [Rhizobium sp. AAP43]